MALWLTLPPFSSNAGFGRYLFTAIYSVELVGKAIALGLVGHPHAYLRDGWSVLDCVVVGFR
jgi:hypothetical protein